MEIFINVKHCEAIWKLTMLGCEAKASTCFVIKENLILYCCKFSAFIVTVIKKSVSQRTIACKRNC